MGRSRRRPSREAIRRERQQRQQVWLALGVILLLAAGLRFWQLGTMPPGLYHDEAYNGLDALALNRGETFPLFHEGWELYAAEAHAERPAQETRFPVFFEGNYGREPLHIYLMALSIRLFGATPFALRAVPAASGVLAMLMTFLATQTLLGSRAEHGQRESWPPVVVALVAALVLVLLFPAVHFSRFALRMMPFVVVEVAVVWAFWRGVNEPAGQRATLWFLLAGALLGLALYIYAVARLLPLLFVCFVPLWFWLDPAARTHWRRVAVMAVTAFVTALPLLIFFARYPYFFIFRIGYVANKGLGTFEGRPWLTWLYNIGRVVRGLFWQGETHLRHNLPGRPYLDPIQALFFVLGLVATVRAWASPQRLRYLFLWLWLIIMLLPSILSGDAPHFGRMSGAAPPLAILIALGAAWAWERLVAVCWTGIQVRPLAVAVLLLAALISAGLTIRDYFGRYRNHPQLAADFYLDEWRLGQAAAAEPAGTMLYLTPTQEEMATIYFALGGERTAIANYNGGVGAVPAGQPNQPAVYFLRPGETAALERLQNYFPDGQVEETEFQATLFRVPAGVPRLPGSNPTDAGFSNGTDTLALLDWTVTEVEEGEDTLFVTLYWQAAGPVAQRYTAYVHLLDEAGSLLAQDDHQPAGFPTIDWRPGEIVADTFTLLLPDTAGTFTVQTGFYDALTLAPLGELLVLGRVTVADE